MRTFHVGGAAQISVQSFIESNFDGTIRLRNKNVVRNSDGEDIVMVRTMAVIIVEEDCGTTRGITLRAVVEGGDILVSLGQRILGRFTAEATLMPFLVPQACSTMVQSCATSTRRRVR